MQRYEFIFASAIIILLATIMIRVYVVYNTPFTPSDVQLPNLNWIGVIDYNNDGKVSKESIIKGEDLLIHAENPLNNNLNKISKLHHITDLDTSKDSVLTIHDPQYERLKVLFIEQTDELPSELRTLDQVGIYGIRLNKITSHRKHAVILGDSSERLIHPVPKEVKQKNEEK